MKIAAVEAIPVRLPLAEPVSDSWGRFASSDHGIVVIRGESGAYGLGEIALAWFGGAHALCREVNEHWAARLVGLDASRITAILGLIEPLCRFSKRHLLAAAGVEMALWDLVGKTLGVPVHALLGGKVRETIPLTGGVRMDSVEAMVQSAAARVEQGYRELKLKVGLQPEKDLQAVRRVREAIPGDVRLRVDVNTAWRDVKLAKRMIDELWGLGVEIVEQPLHEDRLAETAWLRRNTDARILIDEGVWDAHDAKRVLDAGAADMLHVYVSEAGGIGPARRVFELASLYGVDCTLGSMPEGRIGAAAAAQVGAAMANLSPHASDVRGFTGYRDDVVNEELEIRDGALVVGDAPGLGVTLDMAKLTRLRADR